MAHWSTWAPLDNTDSWRGGCAPSFSLPVTHWTPLAENQGGEEDKKERKMFPYACSGTCSQLGLLPPPSPETLDLGVAPPQPSVTPTSHLQSCS